MNFSRIEIITSEDKLDHIIENLSKQASRQRLHKIGVSGITVSKVSGCGVQLGALEYEETTTVMKLLPKCMIMIVCESQYVDELLELLKIELYTGHIGDGKIFVSDVTNIIRVRTGEEGRDALNKSIID